MGMIPPAKFIPLAEATGLIVELDRFVMKTAMKQLAKWYAKGLNPGKLAMNLAVKQLQQKDFIQVLKNLMKETGCKPQWIALEVTESQIMSRPEVAIKILNQISATGVELAVDDFGTGYSSLAYLKKLPIDKLKIDQSFVKDLPDDEDDKTIAKAVIALATSLNLKIIAEGVESKEQKDFLIKNGCENIQGYYYSKPIPADKFEVFLVNGSSKNKML
jgi:EAL domain-containing protein (putative c-di-GMP-specific phosphodiesterase class I)